MYTDASRTSVRRRLSICLINPRSQPSYWTFDYAMPFFRVGRERQYSMANGSLVSVAALIPAGHEIVLIDENVESLDIESLRRFDVIGVTGMIVQSRRMREILLELKSLPATVVVGGPFVTINENAFDGLCDVKFIGEAEETWPAFLDALVSGGPVATRYEQSEKTDMGKVPVPRFDLLARDRYVSAPVQFSRGCPFLCEFCDIITIFGRRPRVKQPEQVIAELEALVAQGFSHCFLVDDNFIGNKIEAKKLLRAMIDWQAARHYPLAFSTEASINLANDPELLDLMVRANFRQVFVGIETPNEASLEETRKHQNVHGDSLLEKIARIRAGGLVVVGGFIVGFDNDDENIFDEQFDFIQASGISNLSISLLTPLPTTPLYDRLSREGRLDFGDPDLIYIPRNMSREQLKAGFHALLRRVFDPAAYFERALQAVKYGQRTKSPNALVPKTSLGSRLRSGVGATVRAARLAYVISRQDDGVKHLRVAAHVVRRNAALGSNRLGFEALVNLWVNYWHFASVTRQISGTQFGIVPGSLPTLAGETEVAEVLAHAE